MQKVACACLIRLYLFVEDFKRRLKQHIKKHALRENFRAAYPFAREIIRYQMSCLFNVTSHFLCNLGVAKKRALFY